MMGHTIRAVIRRYNSVTMTEEDLKRARVLFSELNPHAHPPKLGQSVLVPILRKYDSGHKD